MSLKEKLLLFKLIKLCSPAIKFIEIKSLDYLSFANMNFKMALKNLINVVIFSLSQADSIQNTLPPVCAAKVHINISQTNLSEKFVIPHSESAHGALRRACRFPGPSAWSQERVTFPWVILVRVPNTLCGVFSELRHVGPVRTPLMGLPEAN